MALWNRRIAERREGSSCSYLESVRDVCKRKITEMDPDEKRTFDRLCELEKQGVPYRGPTDPSVHEDEQVRRQISTQMQV